jgi:hypothetical protein
MAFVNACRQGEVQAFGACSSATIFHAFLHESRSCVAVLDFHLSGEIRHGRCDGRNA